MMSPCVEVDYYYTCFPRRLATHTSYGQLFKNGNTVPVFKIDKNQSIN
jgi:hypothetical protein